MHPILGCSTASVHRSEFRWAVNSDRNICRWKAAAGNQQLRTESLARCYFTIRSQDHRGRFGSMQLAAQSQPQMQPCLSSVPKRSRRQEARAGNWPYWPGRARRWSEPAMALHLLDSASTGSLVKDKGMASWRRRRRRQQPTTALLIRFHLFHL